MIVPYIAWGARGGISGDRMEKISCVIQRRNDRNMITNPVGKMMSYENRGMGGMEEVIPLWLALGDGRRAEGYFH